ncbi:tubulin binding cofactor A [Cyathus striatus]|nr:tubulin binding cofactor A [Cyathus striatus]
MSDISSVKRQLKIKSGVVKRLLKEHRLYQEEADGLKQKGDKLAANGADEWDIKNAWKMHDESNRMVTDVATRLGKATGELRDLVVSAKKVQELAQVEEFLRAEEILEEANA